jgi:hypothetical protein
MKRSELLSGWIFQSPVKSQIMRHQLLSHQLSRVNGSQAPFACYINRRASLSSRLTRNSMCYCTVQGKDALLPAARVRQLLRKLVPLHQCATL